MYYVYRITFVKIVLSWLYYNKVKYDSRILRKNIFIYVIFLVLSFLND